MSIDELFDRAAQKFCGLKTNPGTMVLRRQPAHAIASVAVDGDEVLSFRGGEELAWSIGEVRQ